MRQTSRGWTLQNNKSQHIYIVHFSSLCIPSPLLPLDQAPTPTPTIMAPSGTTARTYQPSSSSSAQDAFDANLNKTVLMAAFVLGALIQLGVTIYLGLLVVRRCRRSKQAAGKEEGVDRHEVLRPLVLPGLAYASESLSQEKDSKTLTLKRLVLSPASVSHSPSQTSPQSFGAHTEQLGSTQNVDTWHEFFSPGLPRSGSRGNACDSPSSPVPSLTLSLPRAVQADVETAIIANLSSSLDIGIGADNHASVFDHAMTSTIVEIIEPAVNLVPRIVVEHFTRPPMPLYFADTDLSPSDSIMNSDSDSSSVDDSDAMSLKPDDVNRFLAVPPMSWNAPRDLVDNNYDACEQDWTKTSKAASQKKMGSAGSSISSRVFSVLSDISNVTRFRPKLHPDATPPFDPSKHTYASSRRGRGQGRENENAVGRMR
ncbi:hypothetical protein BC835DRAFT_298865 [Cytidiella melzeri]|nr:hypothetical protein BC835DRAFT_298865 [Cytidiella melzeri]